MNTQEIYKEIERIEAEYAKGNIDPKSIYHYRSLVFQVKEQKRLFDTMIKYEFYNKDFKIQQIMFSACYVFGQKAIYDRYLPNFFPKVLLSLAQQGADYATWYHWIDQWVVLNKYVQAKSTIDGLALHFIATLVTLQHQGDKQQLLQHICQHPIYKEMIPICHDFFQSGDMAYISQLHDILFPHIQRVRETHNYDDPWLNFYSDFTNSKAYIEFTKPYYDYMDKHHISYDDKLIFCLWGDNNVGDYYWATQYVIHWSLHHKIPLIAMLTPKQISYLGVYFKDYFDAIIIRNANIEIPNDLYALFPTPNRVVSITKHGHYQDIPPYYIPRSRKRHFNYYTHDRLYDENADIGQPVAISPPSQETILDNQHLIKEKQLIPEKTILIAPHGNAVHMHAMSNITLHDFWQELVNKLQNEGFTPLINLSYPNEQHYLNNVDTIYLPIANIVDFINQIGFFIGVRSGLCDLLISSDNPNKYCVSPIEHVDWGNDLATWFKLVNLKFADISQHIDDIINSLHGEYVASLENHHCYGYQTMPDLSE